MTEAEVFDKVWEWLSTVTGVTVIYAYQGENEPAEPYGVLNLMMSSALYENPIENEYTEATIDDPDEPGTDVEQVSQAPVRDWLWRFSVNVYGPNGQTILRKIKTAEKVTGAQAGLYPLILFETSQIRDATELVNEEWRGRAQMDIEIRGLIRDGLPIDTAETADVILTSD